MKLEGWMNVFEAAAEAEPGTYTHDLLGKMLADWEEGLKKYQTQGLAMNEDYSAICDNIDALHIIFSAPLWPARKDLDMRGQLLYDAIVQDAKPLALAIAREVHSKALEIIGAWSKSVTDFIEHNKIDGNEANERLLQVFLYYADACGIDLKRLTH